MNNENEQKVKSTGAIEESTVEKTVVNDLANEGQKFTQQQKPIASGTTAKVNDGASLYTSDETYKLYKKEFSLPVDKRSVDFKFYPNLPIPSTTRSGYDKSISQFQNRRAGDTESQWLDTYLSSAGRLPSDRFYEAVLNKPDSDWSTSVEHAGVKMTQASSKKTPAGELRGSAAVDAVLRKNKRPGTSRMPLWHSGFWVYYRPMNGQDISDLLNAIASAKAIVGNMTYGRSFATDTAYIDKVVLQFFFDRLVTTSSIASSDANIDYMSHILLPDKNVIYGYMMSKCFPSGFAYNRSCISPGCGTVHDGVLDMENIVRVDKSKLTEKQKQHMLNMGDGSTSLEAIAEYQNEFDWVNRDFTSNDVKYVVKIPTLRVYIDSSNSYLDSIHSMYTEAMFEDPKERSVAMRRSMDSTTCVQYAHYITEIVVENTDEEGTTKSFIKETATISAVLESLSTDSQDVKTFVRNINKASADSIIALCAITSFKCSACGTWQNEGDSDESQILIPIDPLSTFFSLASQTTEEQNRVARAI
jgi:hypothetical protein